MDQTPHTPDDDRPEPTTDHPLHGEPRPLWKPLLLLLAFLAALFLLYFFGLEVLVPAD